jgi:hypothetical protein
VNCAELSADCERAQRMRAADGASFDGHAASIGVPRGALNSEAR